MFRRIKQTIAALTSKFTPAMYLEIKQFLSPEEFQLFNKLDRATKCHCYSVYQELKSAKVANQQLLLKAALLHDLGKALVPIKLSDRIAFVLLSKLPDIILLKVDDWLMDFWPGVYTIAHHPELGADQLRQIEAEPALIQLVLQHHNQAEQDPLLLLLRDADELH